MNIANLFGSKIREDILESMQKTDLGLKTMDNCDFEGKVVLLRVDMNLPFKPGTQIPTDLRKVEAVAETTLKELLAKGARVAILTHQGRPGDADFGTTELHAKLLSDMLNTEVVYVPDVYGEKAVEAMKKLKRGVYKVLMLENVRTDPEEMMKKTGEEHSKSKQVQTLSALSDMYVNDAFAAAHRSNASLTGYPYVLPSCAGRVMEWELRVITWLLKHSEKPTLYMFGGAKLDDAISIPRHLGETHKADWLFVSGLIGNLYIKAAGHSLGEVNEKLIEKAGGSGMVEEAKEILNKYGDMIVMPSDLAVETPGGGRYEIRLKDLPTNMQIKDIGQESCKIAEELISKAKTIIVSGPPGVYEQEAFSIGTRAIFKAIAESPAFSVAGGGHTSAAIDQTGYAKDFGYISTAGGALTEMLKEKELPAIEALKRNSH